eukprot:5419912-Prymnesium_polylepis.1
MRHRQLRHRSLDLHLLRARPFQCDADLMRLKTPRPATPSATWRWPTRPPPAPRTALLRSLEPSQTLRPAPAPPPVRLCTGEIAI